MLKLQGRDVFEELFDSICETLIECMPAGGQVKLRGGGVVEYDWLVLAMGSSTTFFDIPGVRELTFPFCDYKDAMRVTVP